MILRNENGTVLASNLKVADGFLLRAKGFMFRRKIDPAEAIYFPKCRAIHTVGMACRLDVVFLSEDNEILGRHSAVAPFAVCHAKNRAARHTLELASGRIEQLDLQDGDRLILEEDV